MSALCAAACLVVPPSSATAGGSPPEPLLDARVNRLPTQRVVLRPNSRKRAVVEAESGQPRGTCPGELHTYSDVDFESPTPIAAALVAGMVETEILAVSYVEDAGDFPLRIDTVEMVFGTKNATASTTTHYTLLVYEGNPQGGTIVASFSSSTGDLPAISLPPGTNLLNLQITVDPQDPEPIIVSDNGTQRFSIGFRIDEHNNPPLVDCTCPPPFQVFPYAAVCCPPPSASNSFPAIGINGATHPNENWVWNRNCPNSLCALSSGWRRFSSPDFGDYFTGDWALRVTYTPFNCGGTGACCLPTGSCQLLPAATCGAQSGLFLGDGIVCGATPCPTPTGACCLANGTCSENLTRANCEAMAGATYQGNGLRCNQVTCTVRLGACCLPNGSCAPNYLSQSCQSQGGVFAGEGTACGENQCLQACCTPGFCLNRSAAECTNVIGGTPQGVGTTCSGTTCPTGACCRPDGACVGPITPLQCVSAPNQGIYRGNGTNCQFVSCPQVRGACCLQNGNCLSALLSECNGLAGAWSGANTTCVDSNSNGTADICESGACAGVLVGDFTQDGVVNGRDVPGFIAEYMAPGAPDSPGFCRANFVKDQPTEVLNTEDVTAFVACLLAAGNCP